MTHGVRSLGTTARRLGMCLAFVALAGTSFSSGGTDTGDADGAKKENPVIRFFDIGAALGRYTDIDDKNTNGQFFVLRWLRPRKFDIRLNGGRQQRLGESTVGMGAAYGHFFPNNTKLTVGFAASTGELSPQWSTSAFVRRAFFNKIPFRLGYVHDHWENGGRHDRVALGAERWFKHVILDGALRYNMNDPGNHTGWGGNISATYYRWKALYVGGGYNFGEVRYEPIGFEDVLVEYEARGYYLSLERWLNSRSGFGIRLGRAEPPESYGIQARWFTEW